jgi:exodeoxyribonuclease-3
VLAGDLNVCPTDLDSWMGVKGKGTIFHTDEERALLDRLRAAGLVDLYRSLHEDDPGYSWWDYRAGAFHRKLGMRLDLLLGTPVVAKRVKEVFVDREFRKKSKASGAVPSDHAPVVARLD